MNLLKKLRTAALLAAAVMITAASLYISAAAANYCPGDNNQDGLFNSKDAVLLAQYLAGWDVNIGTQKISGTTFSLADVTRDGNVDSKDAVLSAQYLAGWDVTICGHWSSKSLAKKTATCEYDGNIACYQCVYCKSYASDKAMKNMIAKEDAVITVAHTPDASGKSCTACGNDLNMTKGLSFDIKENGTYAVIGVGSAAVANMIIPSRYKGKTVTEISDFALGACNFITSVTIPSSVTDIGECAFTACMSLTKVKLSEGLKRLGHSAFYECPALAEIKLPSSLSYIGNDVFYGCPVLVQENGISYVDTWAVIAVTSLSEAKLRNGTVGMAEMAFTNCKLLEKITLPDSMKHLSDNAFEGCSSLTSIKLPNGIKKINDLAFKNCTSLKTVTLPSNLTEIGRYAFQNCAFETLTLPSSLTAISSRALFGCNSLKTINFKGTTAQWKAISIADECYHSADNDSVTVQCSDGKLTLNDCMDATP